MSEESKTRRGSRLGAGVVGAVLGGGVVGAVVAATGRFGWHWPTLAEFTTSAGFGGVAALGAAGLAYAAARWTARTSRDNADADRDQRERSDRKEQWWKRAQWAMDLTFDAREEVAKVGYDVLEALAESEWAEVHEGDVIAAATVRVLEDQGETSDDEDDEDVGGAVEVEEVVLDPEDLEEPDEDPREDPGARPAS